jgi:hypothetical protein
MISRILVAIYQQCINVRHALRENSAFVILTLKASTNRIGLDVAPVGNYFETFLSPPTREDGSATRFVVDSFWTRRDSDGFSSREQTCGQLTDNHPATCYLEYVQSYTLNLDAHVEGVALTVAIHVSVVPCLNNETVAGDSLLNDNRLRTALRMALDSSPQTGSPWDRRERGLTPFSTW